MEEQIKKLAEEIKNLEVEEATQEGVRQQLLSDLEKKFDITSLETAVELLEEIRDEMKVKKEEIDSKIDCLEKMVEEVKNGIS